MAIRNITSLSTVPKRNGGKWTEAKFNSFIKSALRSASQRWEPKYTCLNDAFVDKRINTLTGRISKHYKCAACNGVYAGSYVFVDHISPVIDPAVGFTSWDDVINRLFCEKDNLQVLCKPCHDTKTAAERQLAKERKNDPRV